MIDSVDKTDHNFTMAIGCFLRYLPKGTFLFTQVGPYNIQIRLLNGCVRPSVLPSFLPSIPFFLPSVLIIIVFYYLAIFLQFCPLSCV